MKTIKTIQTVKELKDKISELEMRLYIQKLHCRLFHRSGQKFTTWIKQRWYLLVCILQDFFNES